MGYVTQTITSSINDAYTSESLHFEDYEDFVTYHEPPTPVDFGCSKEENQNNIYLTEDEIYTLRVLLGHTVGDKDCNRLAEKLELLDPTQLDCDDYDKLYFTFIENSETMLLENGEKEPTIRFKQVEEE